MEAQRGQGAPQHGMASLRYGHSPQHQPSPWPPFLLHFSSLMGWQPREVTWPAAPMPAAPLPPSEASSCLCLADPDPGLRRGPQGAPSWSTAWAPAHPVQLPRGWNSLGLLLTPSAQLGDQPRVSVLPAWDMWRGAARRCHCVNWAASWRADAQACGAGEHTVWARG